MHGEVASVIPHTAKGSPMITHSGAEAASEDDAWTIPASRPAGSKSPRLADAAAGSAGPNAVDGPIGAASKATAPGCPNGAAQASPSGAADGGDEVDIERFIREERQKRPVPLGLKRAVTKKQKQEEGTWRRAQAMAWIGKYAGDAKSVALKTKWLLEMLVAVENNYSTAVCTQHDELVLVGAQLAMEIERKGASAKRVREQIDAITRRQQHAEQFANHELAKRLQVEHELVEVHTALAAAKQAALRAAEECASLQRAVEVSNRADSVARKRMAHRSLQLRDTLVHTKSEVRQHRQIVRKQSHQIDKITHDKAQALQQQALDMSQVEGQASQLAQDKATLRDRVAGLTARLQQMQGDPSTTRRGRQ